MLSAVNPISTVKSASGGENAPANLSKDAASGFQSAKAEDKKSMEMAEVKEVVQAVQENLRVMHKVNLNFSVHKASGRIIVKIQDEETGKIIREIPPDEVLNLAAKFDEMMGMFFDGKG